MYFTKRTILGIFCGMAFAFTLYSPTLSYAVSSMRCELNADFMRHFFQEMRTSYSLNTLYSNQRIILSYPRDQNEKIFFELIPMLKKHILKFIDRSENGLNPFTADFEKNEFSEPLLYVSHVGISKMLRSGIITMDVHGYAPYDELISAFFQLMKIIQRKVMNDALGNSQQSGANAFFNTISQVEKSPHQANFFFKMIFLDHAPGSHVNTGRGGRQSTLVDLDGSLFVRVPYGHTHHSLIQIENAAPITDTLADTDTLIHGTPFTSFVKIMSSKGLMSGEAIALMLEKTSTQMIELASWSEERQKLLSKEGAKDAIGVATRHLPDAQGKVVLIESQPYLTLRRHGVRVYRANPGAGIYQVRYGDELGELGYLGMPKDLFKMFHVFFIDKEERTFLGSFSTPNLD